MTTTRLRNFRLRARRTWNDLDYVQRRLFEMQTGIPVTGGPRRVSRDPSTRLYRRDY
jgi:hypothetical protein